MAETWRVVLADGSVREVRVELCESGQWRAYDRMRFGDEYGVTPGVAVTRLTLRWPDRAREILAPGEPTRAEIIAERDDLRAQIATARREGAEAMRADVKRVFVLHRAVREGREEALRAEGVPQGDCAFLCLATAVVSLDRVMREVEALPLPGDATGGEP